MFLFLFFLVMHFKLEVSLISSHPTIYANQDFNFFNLIYYLNYFRFNVDFSSWSKQLPSLVVFENGKEIMRRPYISPKGTVVRFNFTKVSISLFNEESIVWALYVVGLSRSPLTDFLKTTDMLFVIVSILAYCIDINSPI